MRIKERYSIAKKAGASTDELRAIANGAEPEPAAEKQEPLGDKAERPANKKKTTRRKR